MRQFLLILCVVAFGKSLAQQTDHKPLNDSVFIEITVEELQNLYETNEVSSVQVVEWYLNRIKHLDEGVNGYHSVIEVNPEAIDIARQLDDERENNQLRGPLHGIPFMVKDNIDTGDKMQTTAGSLALKGHYAKKDAPLVQQLRDAGAILIGKTNLSEWANFRSTNSSSGWSSRGGQTNNPYNLKRNPCGSSAGSGVAVSANLCTLAIGTETNGSIVCPSAVNGIVGVKPTVGLISRSGIIPISYTQDSGGPMARTVTDAAMMLGAMTAEDPKDEKTMVNGRTAYNNYIQFLKNDGLAGKRIGIMKGFDIDNKDTMEAFRNAIETMKSAGAEVFEVDVFPEMNDRYSDAFALLQFEFKDGLNKYLQTAEDVTVKNLEDIITFNEDNADKVLTHFNQDILKMSQERKGLESEEYNRMYERVHKGAQQAIDSTMNRHELDAIIAPTTGPAWCTDWVYGDNYPGGSSSLAAWAGYPIMNVPMGRTYNLPLGISFYGRAWSESTLLAIAYAYEQQTNHRFTPTVFKN